MKRLVPCFLSFLLCFLFFIPLPAQDFVVSKNSDFKWRLLGRVMFDGGVFFNDKSELGNAVEINDLRIGTQVSFLENWEVKLEIGYAESRVSLKDVYIGYQAGKHLIRLGHYLDDVTVGLNYFFNKYIAAKLNYAHVMVGHDAIHGAEDFDLIQARVQFSF